MVNVWVVCPVPHRNYLLKSWDPVVWVYDPMKMFEVKWAVLWSIVCNYSWEIMSMETLELRCVPCYLDFFFPTNHRPSVLYFYALKICIGSSFFEETMHTAISPNTPFSSTNVRKPLAFLWWLSYLYHIQAYTNISPTTHASRELSSVVYTWIVNILASSSCSASHLSSTSHSKIPSKSPFWVVCVCAQYGHSHPLAQLDCGLILDYPITYCLTQLPLVLDSLFNQQDNCETSLSTMREWVHFLFIISLFFEALGLGRLLISIVI